jgi:hypothetical protein
LWITAAKAVWISGMLDAMDNLYAAQILRAVARDLDMAAGQLARSVGPCDPIPLLAMATRGRDDYTRRVCCANIAVAEAITSDTDTFDALGELPPWPGEPTR